VAVAFNTLPLSIRDGSLVAAVAAVNASVSVLPSAISLVNASMQTVAGSVVAMGATDAAVNVSLSGRVDGVSVTIAGLPAAVRDGQRGVRRRSLGGCPRRQSGCVREHEKRIAFIGSAQECVELVHSGWRGDYDRLEERNGYMRLAPCGAGLAAARGTTTTPSTTHLRSRRVSQYHVMGEKSRTLCRPGAFRLLWRAADERDDDDADSEEPR
jgi:hypothetical protein